MVATTREPSRVSSSACSASAIFAFSFMRHDEAKWAFRVPTSVGLSLTNYPTEVGTLSAHFASRAFLTQPAVAECSAPRHAPCTRVRRTQPAGLHRLAANL